MTLVTKSVIVDQPQVGRIDRVVQALAACSRSQLRGLFDNRCVCVNEHVCIDLSQPTKLGDQITLRFDPNQRYPEKKITWREPAFSIVFEDRDLIVVDKSAHVLSVPTDHGESNTLVDRVSNYLRHNSGAREAIVVHRLDRGVSGLLVFAKTREAATRLHALFREHKPARKYVALVDGKMKSAVGTFQSHLATGDNLDRYSTENADEGELAITHYRVLKQLQNVALVEVCLETGRRNQIRVHFAEAGHPVLGDPRYGRKSTTQQTWTAPRLALHAASLEFEHPHSGHLLSFESPMPPEMNKFMSKKKPESRRARRG